MALGANGVRGGDDLGDREIDIDVGLEIKLLDGDAVEGLRLDIPDAVDARRDRILTVGCHPLLHLGSPKTCFLPNHRHDGDVDLGKNVGRHGQNRRHAQHEDSAANTKNVCGNFSAKRTIPMTRLLAFSLNPRGRAWQSAGRSAHDRAARNVVDVAAANADVAEIVVGELGQLTHGRTVAAPRGELQKPFSGKSFPIPLWCWRTVVCCTAK